MQISRVAKTISNKKKKAREVTLPDFKSYYKATIMWTMRFWHKDRHTDQQNRTGSPEMNSHLRPTDF